MGKVIPQILDMLRSNRIKPPYFHNLNELGFGFIEVKRILEEYYGGEIQISNDMYRMVREELEIYREEFVGTRTPIYMITEHLGDRTIVTEGNVRGEYNRHVYNNGGLLISKEINTNEWVKWEYDIHGNVIYLEDINGIIYNTKQI